MRNLILLAILTVPAWPAEELTAPQAVLKALANSPALQATTAAGKTAAARTSEMRGARLPHVTYTELWQRSDNPVFVFGSLLNQRQFQSSNFDLGSLNHPPFVNNFQSQVTLDQTVYDHGFRQARLRAAELGQSLSAEDARANEMTVIATVLRAYYSAALAEAQVGVSAEAVRSASADVKRAEDRLTAGFTTDADVLSIRVHMAAVREEQIRRQGELELALASLNEAMGIPLDSSFTLVTPLTAAVVESDAGLNMEKDAVANGSELRLARIQIGIRDEQSRAARAALWPEAFVRGGFEADRQRFVNRGGANWMISAGLRWNVFDGFSDRARIRGAESEVERTRALEREAKARTELNAKRATLELRTTSQRIEVAGASVAMAQEGLRIIRNRYEAGLTSVTELLRSETALLAAQTRALEAALDQRMAAVSAELVRGSLSKDSDVVNK
ncbi:MAG: TolC family protein [Bryobacteraceae bacterium]